MDPDLVETPAEYLAELASRYVSTTLPTVAYRVDLPVNANTGDTMFVTSEDAMYIYDSGHWHASSSARTIARMGKATYRAAPFYAPIPPESVDKIPSADYDSVKDFNELDAIDDLNEIDVGTGVELSCPFCQGPISAVLHVLDVVHSRYETVQVYKIKTKACDCPIASFAL